MIKANLTEVRDLGMQVNRHDTSELVDHCILKFTTDDGQEVETYPLPKTSHGSSRLGKIIRILLGRNLTKTDYTEEMFNSDDIIGKSAYLELSENKITEVVSTASFSCKNE